MRLSDVCLLARVRFIFISFPHRYPINTEAEAEVEVAADKNFYH